MESISTPKEAVNWDSSESVAMSIVYSSNKGGSSKSTISVLHAIAAAAANPERTVIFWDCSLYGDATTQLLGGFEPVPFVTDEGQSVQRARGIANAHAASCTGSMLIRAAGAHALLLEAQGSWVPNSQWRLISTLSGQRRVAAFDPMPFILNVVESGGDKSLPPNLFLVPGGPSLEDPGLPWEAASKTFQDALKGMTLDGSHLIIFDTDHDLGAPNARFALSLGESIHVPIKTDAADLERLFADNHGLFPVLRDMRERGFPTGVVSRLIFTQLKSSKYEQVELELGGQHATPSAFDVSATDLADVRARLDRLRQYVLTEAPATLADGTLDTDGVVLVPLLPPSVLKPIKNNGVNYQTPPKQSDGATWRKVGAALDFAMARLGV